MFVYVCTFIFVCVDIVIFRFWVRYFVFYFLVDRYSVVVR